MLCVFCLFFVFKCLCGVECTLVAAGAPSGVFGLESWNVRKYKRNKMLFPATHDAQMPSWVVVARHIRRVCTRRMLTAVVQASHVHQIYGMYQYLVTSASLTYEFGTCACLVSDGGRVWRLVRAVSLSRRAIRTNVSMFCFRSHGTRRQNILLRVCVCLCVLLVCMRACLIRSGGRRGSRDVRCST